MQIENPARKGDAVAVRVRHSATAMHGPTTAYYVFHLATVAEASREGKVRRITMAGSNYSIEAARVGDVLTIKAPQLQAAAKRLIEATRYGAPGYDTAEALKAAIHGEAAAPVAA